MTIRRPGRAPLVARPGRRPTVMTTDTVFAVRHVREAIAALEAAGRHLPAAEADALVGPVLHDLRALMGRLAA